MASGRKQLIRWHGLEDGHLPCLGCGYDLRGCAEKGRCPECGRTYNREELYADVAHQKMRDVIYDAQFVWWAGLVTSPAVAVVWIISHIRPPSSGAMGFVILELGIVLTFFYSILVVMYATCGLRLYNGIWRTRTLSWGQTKGIGLHRELFKAGAILLPPILVFAVV